MKLYQHQEQAVDFIKKCVSNNHGGLLFLTMGAGKTLTSLCAMKGQCLFLCGSITQINQLVGEITKHKLNMSYVIYHDSETKTINDKYDVIFTTVDKVLSDYNKKGYLFQKIWDMVFLDESHNFSNSKGKKYRALFNLPKKYMFCMTGTPISNSASDLFVQLSLCSGLDPEIFTSLEYDHLIFESDYKPDLPELIIKTIKIDHPNESELITEKDSLDHFIKQKTSCLEYKYQPCVDLINSFDEDDVCLIFSTMIEPLNNLVHKLGRSVIIHGDTPEYIRKRIIKNGFNKKYKTILISMQIGSTSLNLTFANKVIILDKSWNNTSEIQAACRAYRPGQTKEVEMYYLLIKNSIEEKMVIISEIKDTIMDGLKEGKIIKKPSLKSIQQNPQ